jgi:hypothetical protein
MTVTQQQLVGRWKSDMDDQATRSGIGAVIQEFFPDGLLMYAAQQNGQTAVLEMRYRLDGEWLVTDQPSAPREERARVILDTDGRLVVGSGAERAVFLRAPGATLAER